LTLGALSQHATDETQRLHTALIVTNRGKVNKRVRISFG
jgi:hypothetical protein